MAQTSQNTIELNGKHYDVVTGNLLAHHPAHQAAGSSVHGQSIDGLSAPKTHAHSTPKPVATNTKPPQIQHIDAVKKPAGARTSTPLTAHQQQSSKTLMRHAVKRPEVHPKTSIRTQNTTDMTIKRPSAIVPKNSYYQTDPRLVDHAQAVARSQQISHFSRRSDPRPTQPAAAVAAPVKTRPTTTDYSAATTRSQYANKVATPARSAKPVEDDDQSIFEQVLASAKSHEQKPIRRTKKQAARAHRRGIGIAASVMAVVLLGLFIAYQNRASINLQLASAKAGFSATTPNYKPTGYALKDISASPGNVNIRYSAPQGGKILIGQKESNWDSQTLQENYLALSDQKYQTHHDAGKTIFTYGSHRATWVDGGVWYQIQGNATTNDNQLVHIAASM